MTKKVKIVTGYIPIPVKHLDEAKYKALADQLVTAADGRIVVYDEGEMLNNCWLNVVRPNIYDMPPAAPVPSDRYPSPQVNIMSHVIQHNRTTWARRAAEENPDVAVWVWADYGIMKQGAWNGKPILAEHVSEFLDRVERYAGNDIPFPGIEERKPISIHGNNWRFCGSLHIWPTRYLYDIDICYKTELMRWLYHFKCVPLDLAIWPLVEERSSLPFRWYKAEYDHTQLTEFPGAAPQT